MVNNNKGYDKTIMQLLHNTDCLDCLLYIYCYVLAHFGVRLFSGLICLLQQNKDLKELLN